MASPGQALRRSFSSFILSAESLFFIKEFLVYKLDFEISGLPPTTNGSHGHWAIAAAQRRQWRAASASISRTRRPDKPLERVSMTLTRFSGSKPDRDNLAISFKPIIDGLRDGGIIVDDTDEIIVNLKYQWEKIGPRKGKVRIEVVEIIYDAT